MERCKVARGESAGMDERRRCDRGASRSLDIRHVRFRGECVAKLFLQPKSETLIKDKRRHATSIQFAIRAGGWPARPCRRSPILAGVDGTRPAFAVRFL